MISIARISKPARERRPDSTERIMGDGRDAQRHLYAVGGIILS